MEWIGLTGGIASGKSTVSKLLQQQNIAVVDADLLAHLALEPGQVPYDQVVNYFGKSIVDDEGKIDRRKLGEIAFKDKEKLKKLESFIHPFVQHTAAEERRRLQDLGHKFAIYDVPLLFEKSLQNQFDRTVVVYARQAQQIERMIKRNQLTKAECLERLSAQIDIEGKKNMADDVILNTGTLEDLKDNVSVWLKKIQSKYV